MNKKILILLLTMVMGITCMLPADTYASEIDAQSEIQETLENFFEALLGTLSEHSAKDYDSNDFQGIDGYIIAKSFVNTRETYKKLNGGIHEVELEDLVLDNVFEGDGCLEVSAYVKYRYVYGNNESCQVGCLYRVKMAGAEDGYKILDLDNSDIETQKIKEDLHIQEQGIGTVSNDDIFESVDRYFEDMQRGVDDLQQMEDFAVPEDTGAEPASVNISYDTEKARKYGYRLGDNYENYIFHRASLDCTNFASQCVWAGYGGVSGYVIPITPTLNDSVCIALKNRVKADYRMTDSWYGRNYDSTLGDPPSNFCSVESFCNYVTSNNGNGPKATVYNNNKVFSELSVKIRPGDVLQFYKDGKYYHSVVVVSESEYAVSNYSSVRVAQHQSEYNSRSLADLIYCISACIWGDLK